MSDLLDVFVLTQRGAAVLVEWHTREGVHRATVPQSELRVDGDTMQVPQATLQQGVPYGEPWELLPVGTVGAEQVAQALRGSGIWTKEYARAHLPEVRAALQRAYAQDLQKILESLRG